MRRTSLARSAVLLLGAGVLVPLAAPVQAAPVASYAPAHRVTTRVHHDHTPAVHGTHGFTTIDRMVPVKTGPRNDIAIDLDTRLYVPDNASARHPQPAILMTHGFGLDKTSNEVVDTAQFFAAHGYVVETYTSSGFGKSGGCVTLQSADYDVKSAKQLIDSQLAPRKDVLHDKLGPVVGTIGGSYGGGEQLPLAAADKRIRTSIVGRSWNNLAYSLDPNNYVHRGDRTGLTHSLNLQGVFKMEWTSLFYALGNAGPAMGDGGCVAAKTASGDPTEIAAAGSCPGYYLPLCTVYEQLTSTGNTDAAGRRLIARASAATFLPRIHIPVLLVQGQSDTLFNENDASATYLALKKRHVPVGMIWNSGGHGGYVSQPGECEMYDGIARTVKQMDDCYLTLRSLGWMDHWLRHTKGGRGPAFTYYRDWTKYAGKGADDEKYGVSQQFPLGRGLRFTLSGDTALDRKGRTPTKRDITFLNPPNGEPGAYTETSNFSGPASSPSLGGRQPMEQEGQNIAFTSVPFRTPYNAVGIPEAHLRLSHTDGKDLVFFLKVYDVPAHSAPVLIHRLIAPVRVPAGAVGRPIDVRLPGFAHRFKPGHAVRLVICSTDLTSYNAKTADTITVHAGKGSTFTLPGLTSR